MNKISVVSLEKNFEKFEENVEKIALKILKILNKSDISAEIYLIGNRKMKFLNKKFRGKDKTTTILSFEEPRNFILPSSKFKRIGEIYLNCQLSAVSCQLLMHGILHLFGYNHQKKNDRIKMERIENWVIRELGN